MFHEDVENVFARQSQTGGLVGSSICRLGVPLLGRQDTPRPEELAGPRAPADALLYSVGLPGAKDIKGTGHDNEQRISLFPLAKDRLPT
jgi:hypothetical protein